MLQKIIIFYPHADIIKDCKGITSEQNGKAFFTNTSATWTLQTYLRLREIDPDIILSPTLPDSGIVIAFEGDLPVPYQTRKDRYLISIIADGSPRSFANIRIVQNRAQTRLVKRSTHISHWPQPGLKQRDAARGTNVENVVYIGDIANIAPEMLSPGFSDKMTKLGVNWSMRFSGDLGVNDYSEVDILVAVRDFRLRGYLRKPASKLQNAWLSGVPAVLGPEIAFREIGTKGADYLEARSEKEVLAAVNRLKNQNHLYSSIVNAGLAKAANLEAHTVLQWQVLFETARTEWEKWHDQSNSVPFTVSHFIDQKTRGIRHRILKTLGHEHNSI